ncbi:MAG: carboxylating nicotinate-nucleotide diphosphorylase [Deltaproteobacteria bacterium]|nr:carboxylating nicotinate-nucleotide diphosphorylase [Deltaproteobacteria bacterium]
MPHELKLHELRLHELTPDERRRIREAIAEDLGTGDITTTSTIEAGLRAVGTFRAKTPLVVAGSPYARAVFEEIGGECAWTQLVPDGGRAATGDEFARAEGPMRALLAAERLALNLLQHLSGIATATAAYVNAVAGTRARITDTRKTIPLWRNAQKYAVACGGGVNHRFGLFDAVLIKDNHLDAVGDIGRAVSRASVAAAGAPVIVEIRRLDEIDPAIDAGATRLLLDNMTPDELAACVRRVDGRVLTEASGNVTLANVRSVARSGVDLISIGALTHSVVAADINFKIVRA